MAVRKEKAQATGYDKYVDWKIFSIPVALLILILAMPTPYGMKDVGMEYQVGPKVVKNYFTEQLFHVDSSQAEQWQLLVAQLMEKNMDMGAFSKKRFMSRDAKWAKKYGIAVDGKNLEKAKTFIDAQVSDEAFKQLMQSAFELRREGLKYEDLSPSQKEAADKGAWQ